MDCKARVLITASGGMRATKRIELKRIADSALGLAASRGFEARAHISRAENDKPLYT